MVQHMYACVSVFVCLYIICVYLYTCAHVCLILTCGHGHIFHSYMPPGDARSHTSCNDPQGVLGPGSAPHPQNFQENSLLQAGLSRNGWSERATWVISLGRLIVHAFNHVLVPIWTKNWVQSGRWLGCKPWFQENSLWQAGFKQEYVPRAGYMSYFSRALGCACF